VAQLLHPQYDSLWRRLAAGPERPNDMRLMALLFTAILIASPAGAQQPPSSPANPENPEHLENPKNPENPEHLPVSLEKIRGALETTPLLSLSTIDERPTFRIQIQEKQKLEELLSTLKFAPPLVPAGGVNMLEQNRIMFPAVDNPLRQPWSEFSQSQLLTLLVENLVRKYVGDKAMKSISHAERAHAEAEAKDEVRAAVARYCGAQPNGGAGIQICDTPDR
jgi:hypothetical protein